MQKHQRSGQGVSLCSSGRLRALSPSLCQCLFATAAGPLNKQRDVAVRQHFDQLLQSVIGEPKENNHSSATFRGKMDRYMGAGCKGFQAIPSEYTAGVQKHNVFSLQTLFWSPSALHHVQQANESFACGERRVTCDV